MPKKKKKFTPDNQELYDKELQEIKDLIGKAKSSNDAQNIFTKVFNNKLTSNDKKGLAKEVRRFLDNEAEKLDLYDRRGGLFNNIILAITREIKKERNLARTITPTTKPVMEVKGYEVEVKPPTVTKEAAVEPESTVKASASKTSFFPKVTGREGLIKKQILEPIDKIAGKALDTARVPQKKLFEMVSESWKEKGVTGKLKAIALAVPATVCFVAVEGVSTAIKEATNCIRKPLAFVYNASATMKNTAAVAGNLINCMVRGFSKENKEELSKATNLLKLTAKDAGKDLFNSAKAIAITALTVSPFAPLVPLAAGAVAGVATIAPMLASVGAPHVVTAGINSGAHAVSQALSQAAGVVPNIPSVSLGKIAVSSSLPGVQGLASTANTIVNGASAGAQAAVNGLISASNSAVKFAPASASVVKAIATKTGAKQNSAAR